MIKKDYQIWIRGEIIPENQAQVSVLSPMAQFGLNVFEGIRCYWNMSEGKLYAFRLGDHLNRLMQSCRLLRMPPPHTIAEIESALEKTLLANDFRGDVAVRMTIFGDGQGSWSSSAPVSMFISAIDKPRTDLLNIPSYRACITSWQRINDNALPPRAKVGANYINGRYAHLQAKYDGYDLPIFLGADGKVAEGAGACLFMLRDNCLVTPQITSSILESITRDTIIRLAEKEGWIVQQRSIDRTELYLADEIFLCGSAAEISPIVSVDGYVLGDGQPGEKTRCMLQNYLAIASGQDVRYPEWRTEVMRRLS